MMNRTSKMSCFHTLSIFLFLTLSLSVFAQGRSDVDEFILQSDVKTYDCPEDDAINDIEQNLALPDISELQKNQLSVKKTHWQICQGKHDDAKDVLVTLLNAKDAQEDHEYFAEASYQLGFIYDVQELEERCDWYQKALSLAKDKFADVNLSAQLGLITVCQSENDEGIRLGKMYTLLEQYANSNDMAALAHIHNNIGLRYARLGQHGLASEQYQKSYEMGLSTYTSSNQLATLISVISSNMASGDFDQAAKTIEEFKKVNETVDTALSNVWLHLSEAGYHYRTGNIPQLSRSLAKWKVYSGEINSTIYTGLFRWYSAVVCLSNQDKECLREFLAEEEKASAGYKAFISKNKDYSKFKVDVYFMLEDFDNAQRSFDHFAEVMLNKFMQQQASGKVLGVANLHSQVITLESNLQATQDDRKRSIMMISGVSLLLVSFLLYWLRRRYLSSLSYDSTTQLLNAKTALNEIRRVSSPSRGRTNALALFDLGNFRDVNRQLGATQSDTALKQIANTLSHVTRDRDILGRFAPEQFIVCLTDIEEDSAKSFFERMQFALENTILGDEEGQGVSIRSSMSIYVSTGTFDDLDEVLDDMQLSLDLRSETSEEP